MWHFYESELRERGYLSYFASMDITKTSSMTSNTTLETQRILTGLDKAEDCVLMILRTASETAQEIEKIPDCDFNQLKRLVMIASTILMSIYKLLFYSFVQATDYVTALQTAQKILLEHGHLKADNQATTSNQHNQNISISARYHDDKLREILDELDTISRLDNR